MAKFEDNSGRVVSLIVTAIIIFAFILSKAFYNKSIQIAQDEFISNMNLTLGQITTSLNYRLENVMETQNKIASHESILRYLSNDPEQESLYQQYVDFQDMNGVLTAFKTNYDISHISLYVNKDKLYANQYSDFYPLSELPEIISRKINENPGQMLWTPPKKIDGIEKLTFYKSIINIENFESIAGVSAIEVNEETIYSIIAAHKVEGSSDIALIQDNGNIISHSNKEIINSKIPLEITAALTYNTENYLYTYENDTNKIFLSRRLENLPWYLVISFPEKEIVQQSRFFNMTVSVIIVVMVIIIGLVTISFIIYFSRKQTIIHMRRISESISKVKPDTLNSQKTVDILGQQVIEILDIIRQQMNQLYENEIRIRDERFRTLQAQINPHFLYNTLDTINWMAIEHDAYDISNILELFANYFRISLSNGKDIILLRDEINLVKNYVEIQKIRLDEDFRFLINIPQEVENCLIPKLTIQPIVENCIVHGIQGLSNGEISLNVQCEKDILLVNISDNGRGIADCSELLNCKKEDNHYGLQNINERLHLFSGTLHHMNMESGIGRGFRTSINLKRTNDV